MTDKTYELVAVEPLIDTFSVRISTADGGKSLRATCPFCGDGLILHAPDIARSAGCRHFLVFRVYPAKDGYPEGALVIEAVFEGTPPGMTHLLRKNDGPYDRCRILGTFRIYGHLFLHVQYPDGVTGEISSSMVDGRIVYWRGGMSLRSSKNDPRG